MNADSTPKEPLSKAAQLGAPAFAVFVALTYGTGFLCVYTFLERFGIHETGAELIKGKYIHVGILFLLFPISILCPGFFALSVRTIQRKLKLRRNAKANIPISSYFLFFNLCWVLYIYVLFLPPPLATTAHTEIAFLIILAASMVGPRAIGWFTRTQIDSRLSHKWSIGLRWGLVAFVIMILDLIALKGFLRELWRIIWGDKLWPTGALLYFLLMALIPFSIWHIKDRADDFRDGEPPQMRGVRELRINIFCLCVMFYFVSALAFGFKVYPHIPVARGGGSYVDAPRVALRFRESVTNMFCVDPTMATSNFIILEQTSTSVFVARDNDTGGPVEWQKMRDLPTVIELNRDVISKMICVQDTGH